MNRCPPFVCLLVLNSGMAAPAFVGSAVADLQTDAVLNHQPPPPIPQTPSLAFIPEPATLMLFAAGAVTILAHRRKNT